MSDNYQSYNAYTGPVDGPAPSQWNAIRVHDTVGRVSISDGSVTEAASLVNDRGNAAELNPHHGDGSIFSTARNPNGSPVTEILGTTLIEVGGVQAPVSFFVSEGILRKNSDGTFSEAPAKAEEAPQADNAEDFQPLDDAAMGTVNQALAEVDQGNLDSLMASGTGVAIGRMDAASLAQRFSSASGLGVAESQQRVAAITVAFQAQADSALQGMGIGAGDLPAFYAWAKASQQGQLQQAVQMQLRTHTVSGYRALASQWQSATAPSIAALQAAGVPVRPQAGGHEVFVNGQWMSPKAAAKAGLI